MSTQTPASCPHAESTTLLWLYGEGPEEHVHHVADCAECARIAATHADVMATVAPVADALDPAEPAAHAVPRPSVLAEPAPRPAPANRGWLLGVVVGLAVAAAVLLGLVGVLGLPGGSSTPIADGPDVTPAPEQVVEVPAPLDAPDPDRPAPDRSIAHDDVPRQVAPLDDVDPDALIERSVDDTATPDDDARLAELLGDDALYAPLDDELDTLFDEFAALEADLTTL